MIEDVLVDIGLTSTESRIYLALLELGQSNAGRVIEKARIQNSVFHFCVNRLISKGLVSVVKKSRFKLYSAADPESLISYVKDKEKLLEELLPQLKERQKKDMVEPAQAEVFSGIKGISAMLDILIEDSKKGDEYCFFPMDFADYLENDRELQKFYIRYNRKRIERGLIVKAIAPKRLKSIFENLKNIHVKYVDFDVPANSGTCNDKHTIMAWGKNPVGIMIRSKEIARKQIDFFNAVWKSIK